MSRAVCAAESSSVLDKDPRVLIAELAQRLEIMEVKLELLERARIAELEQLRVEVVALLELAKFYKDRC